MDNQSIQLEELVSYMDQTLNLQRIKDFAGAWNGLQVENRVPIQRIAAAVDASLSTIRLVKEAGAQLLLVHHGLFWGPAKPWTGRCYEMIRFLVENEIAVYSAHLPLDAHDLWGNNAVICQKLGLQDRVPFHEYEKTPTGFLATTERSRVDLKADLVRILGCEPLMIPGGPEICRKVGVISGGAGSDLASIAKEGVDTLITGEGPHWTYALAEDLGVNVFYGGHYATETFGVRAFSEHLAQKFGLESVFLDYPTGL
jgi:dinuclear metal center YbgI/SA1388 family protein